MTFSLVATSYTTSHLLYAGDGWIEAKRVFHPGLEDGWSWEFKSGQDLIRWLRS
jgi:hypothetical protein